MYFVIILYLFCDYFVFILYLFCDYSVIISRLFRVYEELEMQSRELNSAQNIHEFK